MLVGKSKGRSLAGMRTRVSALKRTPDTRAQGVMLQDYALACEAAHELRGGKQVLVLELDELLAKLKLLADHVTIYPANVAQALLYRRKRDLFTERKFEVFMDILIPWSVEAVDFDAFNAKMCALPRNMAWRLKMFTKVWLEEGLCALVLEGEPALETLRKFLVESARRLEREDAFELDDQPCIVLAETLACVQLADYILRFEVSATCVRDLKSFEKAAASDKTGARYTMLVAIKATPFYESRRTLLLQTEAAIMDTDYKLDQMVDEINSFEGDPGDIGLDERISKCADFLGRLLTKIPSVMLKTVVASFLESVKKHCDAALVDPKVDRIVSLINVLQACSISFPSAIEISKLHSMALEKKQLSADLFVLDALKESFTTLRTTFDKGESDEITKVLTSCNGKLKGSVGVEGSAGFLRSEDSVRLIVDVLEHGLVALPEKIEVSIVGFAMEVTRFLQEKSYIRVVASFMNGANALLDLHALGGSMPDEKFTEFGRTLAALKGYAKENFRQSKGPCNSKIG